MPSSNIIIGHGISGEGEGFDPPPLGADVTRPVEGLDVPGLCSYGKARNVGVRLWVHWKPLAAKLEEAFTLYEQWGIQGLMVDFMDRDDQDMVQWVDTELQSAAKHHLHIQFHGAYKPTGLHRTYPHELTKEGVLILEANKRDEVCDPEHNLIIPFTRMIAGPTDYHAGGFRSVSRENFKAQFHEPLVMGTRAQYLGMYCVRELFRHVVIGDGERGLFGRSVIVSEVPGDAKTRAGGVSGKVLACGVIVEK